MSLQDSDPIDAEIREIFAQADAGPHPSADELTAYARGEMPETAASRVQQHLGPCRECTAMVLALGRTGRTEPGPDHLEATPDGLSDADVEASVEAIVARATGHRAPPTAAHPRPRSPWTLVAAAVLAVASFSLAWLTLDLRQRLGELEAALQIARASPTFSMPAQPVIDSLPPQTGVPIVDLLPPSVARGETAPPILLNAETAMVTLIFTPPSGRSYSAYRLRVLDAEGVELWAGPAQPNPAGTFVLLLPRRFAESGADRVVLEGVDGTALQPLETYALRFELPGR